MPNDSVTVSAVAGGDLAGNATLTLFPSADCTGEALYSVTKAVAGASPQTVAWSNSVAVTLSGTYSWQVSFDSTNAAQRDIPVSCHETSNLTIDNGGTVTTP